MLCKSSQIILTVRAFGGADSLFQPIAQVGPVAAHTQIATHRVAQRPREPPHLRPLPGDLGAVHRGEAVQALGVQRIVIGGGGAAVRAGIGQIVRGVGGGVVTGSVEFFGGVSAEQRMKDEG